MATPSELGVLGGGERLARVAWYVLSHTPVEITVRAALTMASGLEILGPASEQSVPLAAATAPPGRELGLVQAARAGRPWLNPRCLRWIAREIAAIGVWHQRHPGSFPVRLFDEEDLQLLLGLFPSFSGRGWRPTAAEIARAIWLLHEDYHGFDRSGEARGDVVTSATALSYGVPDFPTSWMDRMWA